MVSLPDFTLEKKQFSMFLIICADGINCIDYSLCINLFLGTSLSAGIISKELVLEFQLKKRNNMIHEWLYFGKIKHGQIKQCVMIS